MKKAGIPAPGVVTFPVILASEARPESDGNTLSSQRKFTRLRQPRIQMVLLIR
jgi:hypothetical protein